MSDRVFNRFIFLFSLAGCFVAGMLILFDWHFVDLPCGTGGCDAVAQWPYSKYISAAGFLFYSLIAILCWVRSQKELSQWRPINSAIFGLAIPSAIISYTLIYYADSVLNATCWWCASSAVIITLILLASAFHLSNRREIQTSIEPSVEHKWHLIFALLAVLVGVGYGSWMVWDKTKVEAVSRATAAKVFPKDIKLHIQGPENAPITIVEFSDYQCGNCRVSHEYIVKLLQMNPQSVRFVYRHFPLYMVKGHEVSLKASAAVEMAGMEGEDKFWMMSDLVFRLSKDKELDEKSLIGLAKFMRLNMKTFNLADPPDSVMVRIQRDIADAKAAGIEGTPTFFIFIPNKGVVRTESTQKLIALIMGGSLSQYIPNPPPPPSFDTEPQPTVPTDVH